MSFFRVLVALLISAGIAYGLYLAVDERRLNRAVEAVRTEIIAPAVEAVQGKDPAEVEEEEAAPADADDGTVVAVSDDAAEEATETESVAEPAADGTDDTVQGDDEVDETEATSFAARVEEDTAGDDEASGTDEAEVADPAETTGENDLPRIAIMPAPPETPLPDDAQPPAAMEVQAPLPTARIEAEAPDGEETSGTTGMAVVVETSDTSETTDAVEMSDRTDTADAAETTDATGTATAALGIVNSGMNYVEARETLIEAGWSPRLPATRSGGPNEAENAMIEAGYGELEGCNDADRPICRFEFVDGENRIAAVLTAGATTDPTVIDAFLMNIRAE